MTNEATRLRGDEALNGDEVCELRMMADRVADYVRTDNYRDFDELYPRFSKLLAKWRGD